MRHRRFLRENRSLLALYEYNYMLFRLLLPTLPQREGWHVLEAPRYKPVYLRQLSHHPYTSEWLLGHHFSREQQSNIAPAHCIRLYHDARLVEARIERITPVIKQQDIKRAHNRALAEWLDYCYRRGYRLNKDVVVNDLPDVAMLV